VNNTEIALVFLGIDFFGSCIAQRTPLDYKGPIFNLHLLNFQLFQALVVFKAAILCYYSLSQHRCVAAYLEIFILISLIFIKFIVDEMLVMTGSTVENRADGIATILSSEVRNIIMARIKSIIANGGMFENRNLFYPTEIFLILNKNFETINTLDIIMPNIFQNLFTNDSFSLCLCCL
jgi:hypothetical protein